VSLPLTRLQKGRPTLKVLIACFVTALGLLVGFHTPGAQEPQGSVTYTDVAETLQQRCIICHSGESPPRGLKLDSYANIMTGAADGPVVVAGAPDKSELVRRIRGESQPRMPMGGPPWLPNDDIALIERWITAGAPAGASTGAPEQAQIAPGVVTSKEAPVEASEAGNQPLTYSRVAPILTARCVKCHTANGLMGPAPEGLRLDSYEAVLTSGDHAMVIPGSPDASELLRRIRGQSTPRMPMDGPPYLSDADSGLIERWIAEGTRDANGTRRATPVGMEVRLRGKLTARWAVDGTPLVVDRQTRLDKNPRVGSAAEVRGVILEDGRLRATRIRAR